MSATSPRPSAIAVFAEAARALAARLLARPAHPGRAAPRRTRPRRRGHRRPGTVALRCPAHPAMRALLDAAGRPLAAPSANASGAISPTRAEHVLASLGGRIPLILDGGPTERGLESTIVARRRRRRRGCCARARSTSRDRGAGPPTATAAGTDRGARPARQPLCAGQAAPPRRTRGASRTNG